MRRAFLLGSNGPSFQPELRFANSDAERMRVCLESSTCAFAVNQPKLYKNIYELLADLDSFFGSVDPTDSVVFYFSGHGLLLKAELQLLFQFTEKERLAFTSLSAANLREKLRHCRAQNKLVVLDCCKAGALYDQDGIKSEAEPDIRDLNLSSESHLAFVAGSRTDLAREDAALGGGVMTHFMIDAIENRSDQADKDKDGLISIQDLERWVGEQVDIANRNREKEKQYSKPRLQGEQKGLFYLTLMRGVVWQWPESSGVKHAHEANNTGSGCTVSLIGTGCDAGHYQLRNKEIQFLLKLPNGNTKDLFGFDVHGDGTACASVIVGADLGVAPGVKLFVVGVAEIDGSSNSASILEAIALAARRAEGERSAIILLGYPFWGDELCLEGCNALKEECGVTIIAPVGGPVEGLTSPPVHPGVLAVGAVDFNGRIVSPAPDGENQDFIKPDIFGYGDAVQVAHPRSSVGPSNYAKLSGSAIAAAYVAGIAALINADGLVGDALVKRLIDTAVPIENEPRGRGIARYIPPC